MAYGHLIRRLTPGLRKALVKDYSLPVKVIDDGYLDMYVDDLLPHYDWEYAVRAMLEGVESMGEFPFLKMAKTAPLAVAEEIKQTDAFKEFNSMEPMWSDLAHPLPGAKVSRDPYHPENDRRILQSLDIRQANFSVMRWRFPEVVHNQEDYDDFIRDYYDFDYIAGCKRIRQVLFGNLNPKRQRQLIKHVTYSALAALLEAGVCEPKQVAALSEDEIVLHPVGDSIEKVKACLARLSESIFEGVEFKSSVFTLHKLENSPCYWKRHEGGRIELRKTPAHLFMQAFKTIVGQDVLERDRTFLFEGELAVLKTPKWGGEA